MRCVGNCLRALVSVVCDFSKISTFPILPIYGKLVGISHRVQNFTSTTCVSTSFFNEMCCVLLTHVPVHAACDFSRFSILATSTLNPFRTRNTHAVCIFTTATCEDIVRIIMSCLHKFLLHCISCARNF
jgi:hypothetical protein